MLCTEHWSDYSGGECFLFEGTLAELIKVRAWLSLNSSNQVNIRSFTRNFIVNSPGPGTTEVDPNGPIPWRMITIVPTKELTLLTKLTWWTGS